MNKTPSRKILLWLKDQIVIWTKEKLISEEQAGEISARYDLIGVEKKRIPSKLIAIIAIIGAFLVGTGVILFIASNWQTIPTIVKLIIIFGSIFIVNHFGYYLKYTKGNYPKTGSALLFLGSLMFGAGIWLVAQIFNITSRYHSGVLIWGLGIIPVAWLLGLETILALSISLLSFWSIWKCVDFQIINYSYLILLFGIIFPLCYRQKAKIALFLSLVGFSVWIGVGPFLFYFKENMLLIIPCFLVFGALLYSTGLVHSLIEKLNRYQVVYRFLGIIVLFSFSYIISFKFIAQIMEKGLEKPFPKTFWFIFAIIAFLSLCALFCVLFLLRKKSQFKSVTLNYESIFLFLMLLYPVLILLIPDTIFYAILSNTILLASAIGLIFLGYYSERAIFINLGFIFFIIHFLTRYIDWGWKYLPRSLFFILAGIILLAGSAFMEKKRRGLIKAIEGEK